MTFPVEEVERITGTRKPKKGDPCAYFPGEGLPYGKLVRLVEIGVADPDGAQNDSPTIGEFLEDLRSMQDKIRFIGYVIYPPRSDQRVSIEGFEVVGIDADWALELAERYHHADEFSQSKQPDGTYLLRFWWD